MKKIKVYKGCNKDIYFTLLDKKKTEEPLKDYQNAIAELNFYRYNMENALYKTPNNNNITYAKLFVYCCRFNIRNKKLLFTHTFIILCTYSKISTFFYNFSLNRYF